jgi:hypothetical protein
MLLAQRGLLLAVPGGLAGAEVGGIYEAAVLREHDGLPAFGVRTVPGRSFRQPGGGGFGQSAAVDVIARVVKLSAPLRQCGFRRRDPVAYHGNHSGRFP